MPETTTETAETTETDTTADTTAEETGKVAEETTETTDGAEALGDAGKKALDAMKAKWRAAEATAKETAAQLAALKAKAEGTEAEHKAATEAQKVKDEALAGANERIVKAEVRAAAAAKLADPQDALRFLDVSEYEVGSDGEVDTSQIAQAIDDLIKAKPYLAAQGGPKFTGSADGGARNESGKPSQLTAADMASMSPDQIAEADAAGRFDRVRGRIT